MPQTFNRLGSSPNRRIRIIPPRIVKKVEDVETPIVDETIITTTATTLEQKPLFGEMNKSNRFINLRTEKPFETIANNRMCVVPTFVEKAAAITNENTVQKKIILCTVHFNTPELMDALLKSIELHVPSFHLYIFDNSDKLPYHTVNPNVTIFDNTRGQIINFDKWLEGYPNRFKSKGAALSNWGTAKHTYTIQKCIELINENFILLDSDVLLKRDITPLFDDKYIFVGETTVEPWLKTRRVHPYVCFINVKTCREQNVKYCDEKRLYGLCTSDNPAEYEEYDTGGSFFVDASKFPYREIKCSDYIIHFGAGSWVEDFKKINKSKPSTSDWLSTNKRYWDFQPDGLIVTMTSWKPRITKVTTVIKSILSNSRKPDKFILNLSTEEFPQKEKELPQELLFFVSNKQIELNWVDFNSKQFKKSYPTLLNYPKNIIISVDDDTNYPKDFIDKLYTAYINNGRTRPVSVDSVRWDSTIYSHRGWGTIFERKFFGPYLEVMYNDLIIPELKKGSKYLRDDLFYTYCALLNNVRYDTIQLNLNQHCINDLNSIQPISYGIEVDNSEIYHSSYRNFIFSNFNKTYEALIAKPLKKGCVCTILTDSFIQGGEALIYSFYKQHPDFDGDFVILYCNQYSPLSKASVKRLLNNFPNLVFRSIDKTPYDYIVSSGIIPQKFIPPIIKIEIFKLVQIYNRVVYLDADTVIVGPIDELFTIPHFVTLFPHNDLPISDFVYPKTDRIRAFRAAKGRYLVNNGVIVLNNTTRALDNVYDQLVNETKKYNKHCDYYKGYPDQDIMEHVLLDCGIPDVVLYKNIYNTLKREFKGRTYTRGDVRVIHYVEQSKPWNSSPIEYASVDRVWHSLYNEFIKNKNRPLFGGTVGLFVNVDQRHPILKNFVDYHIAIGFDTVVLDTKLNDLTLPEDLKPYVDLGLVTCNTNKSEFDCIVQGLHPNERIVLGSKYTDGIKGLLGDRNTGDVVKTDTDRYLIINKNVVINNTNTIKNMEFKKIDICCVAKREQLTIKDWVSYHINLGFHKIWIYQNDGPGDTSIRKILKEYIDNGQVTVLDDYANAKAFQNVAYMNFLRTHAITGEYDWVGIFDCDEYFDYNHNLYKSLTEYFNTVEKRCPNIGVLRVNWETYGDNGNYYYEDYPVVERFPNPPEHKISFWAGDDENYHIKSFVRAGVTGNYPTPHNCIPNGKLTYESDFSLANAMSPWYKNYSYEHSKLKHFQTKSLEEYIYRKFIGRTCADGGTSIYNLDYYWHRNKKTPEALKALEMLLKKYKLK